MSYRVEFAPEAVDQLAAIEDCISHAEAAASAVRYVDAIVAYCESLETFPQKGTRRDDLLMGLRVTHCRGITVIAFLLDAERDVVSILGVFYGGQDYERTWRES